MRFLQSIRQATGSFAGESGGNFTVVFAAAATAVMLSAGYGLNLTQLYHVRSDLSQALDSAVTSTARDLTTGKIAEKDARAMVEAFLIANSGSGFAAADKISLDKLIVNRAQNTVEAVASADVALAFPLFGSAATRRVAVQSASLYSDNRVEIAMMLDVTGSMSGQKLKDLKVAAREAVETLLDGQEEENPRIRISMVPFANSVKAGDLAETSVFVETNVGERKQAPGNDDAKAVAASSATRPDKCATERKGAYQYSDVGPDVSMVNRDLHLTEFAKQSGTRSCPRTAVVPLTGEMDTLLGAIGDLQAVGGTAGHIGIQWSWYTLSPKWKNVFDNDSRPAAYDDDKAVKFAILMTDGEFNLSYFDADSVSEVYDDSGKPETRDAARELCDRMRDEKIKVFTIGFKLEEKNAKETMSRCAFNSSYYFETDTGEELKAAYLKIASMIERLTLTQ